ncbi:MAG: TVP38/TMEM64 family protein [Deltaproteobacteria bacterium]|nr:TVP38/TMEM64 family protein [Deltaproteobacteria bacterium]MBW2445412.1 TVP38/TMEM64 family protein [Deltaproteobacteria bacterium]
MIRRLWQRYTREIALVGTIALLALGRVFASQLGIEWNPTSIRELVAGLGSWGPVLFVGLIAFRQIILIPSQILLVAGGLCFGVVAGTLYGALGLVLSGTILFLIARYAGKDAILARIPEELRPVIDAAGRRAGPALIAVGTGYPVGPLSAYHAAAGLTTISLGVFMLSVAVGGLVRGLVYTYFGSALVEGMGGTLLLAGALLLLAALLPLASPRARAWILGTTTEADLDAETSTPVSENPAQE